MTRNEIIFSAAFCIVVAVAAALVVIWAPLGEDAVIAVAAVAGSLGGVLAGQMTVRIDRRERNRVH